RILAGWLGAGDSAARSRPQAATRLAPPSQPSPAGGERSKKAGAGSVLGVVGVEAGGRADAVAVEPAAGQEGGGLAALGEGGGAGGAGAGAAQGGGRA